MFGETHEFALLVAKPRSSSLWAGVILHYRRKNVGLSGRRERAAELGLMWGSP